MNRGICILFRISSDPLAFIGSSGYNRKHIHTHTYTMLNEFLRSKSEKKCYALSEKKDGAVNEWIGPERKCVMEILTERKTKQRKKIAKDRKIQTKHIVCTIFCCLCRRNDIISWLYYTCNPHQCTFIFTHSNVLLTFILFLWVSVITSFGMWVPAWLPAFFRYSLSLFLLLLIISLASIPFSFSFCVMHFLSDKENLFRFNLVVFLFSFCLPQPKPTQSSAHFCNKCTRNVCCPLASGFEKSKADSNSNSNSRLQPTKYQDITNNNSKTKNWQQILSHCT